MMENIQIIKQILLRYLYAAYIFRLFYRHPMAYFYVARSFLDNIFTRDHRRPRNLVLKLSEKCNACCVFCYAQHERPLSKEHELSLEEFKNIIIQAKKMGCYTITLTGGEPLLYPHIEELIRFIYKNHMIPFTSTNGIAASPEFLKRLAKAGLCALNWSVHGPSEVHNRIVGVPGAYEKLIMNAKEAVKLPIVNIVNHVLTSESFHNSYLPQIIESFRGMGFRAVNLLPICMNGKEDELLHEEALKYLDNMAQKPYVLMDTKNYIRPICPAAREDVLVNNYGEVQACPFIPITFGNIRRESLEGIFRRIESHLIFKKDSPICMAARDHEFIRKYLVPIFVNRELPCPVEKIDRLNSQKS